MLSVNVEWFIYLRIFISVILEQFSGRLGANIQPCQWHNNANAATKDKESLVIYYDEYITSIEKTLERISDFLDFEVIGEVNNFEMGKTYGEYFTNDQVVAILKLIRHLATPITMDLLSPYLEKMVAQRISA